MSMSNGADPTRPIAPAFTTMQPHLDISLPKKGIAAQKGGLLNHPVAMSRLVAKKGVK
jgi:hypothetical protein